MKRIIELQTKRLKLRQWKKEDYEAYLKEISSLSRQRVKLI